MRLAELPAGVGGEDHESGKGRNHTGRQLNPDARTKGALTDGRAKVLFGSTAVESHACGAEQDDLEDEGEDADCSSESTEERPEDGVGKQVQDTDGDGQPGEGSAEWLEGECLCHPLNQQTVGNLSILAVLVTQAISLARLAIVVHVEARVELIGAQRPQSDLDLLTERLEGESQEVDGPDAGQADGDEQLEEESSSKCEACQEDEETWPDLVDPAVEWPQRWHGC